MKTKVLAIALFVAASCTATFAQQTDSKQCCQQTEKKECCKKAPQPKCPIMEALESANLTDAQRTAIENLGKQRAEADKQKCDKECAARHEADSLARAAQRQEKLDMLKSLKSILTADQYVTFLENAVVNAQEAPAPGAPGMGQPGAPGHDGKFEGPKGPQGPQGPQGPEKGQCPKKAEGKCCQDAKK
jgi:Spy/CpxP family protein refolding chaperone